MRVKYTGAQHEILLRHVLFQRGKPVDLDEASAADASLLVKVLALPEFEEVKAGRPKKVKANDEERDSDSD